MVFRVVEGFVTSLGSISGTDATPVAIKEDTRALRVFLENPPDVHAQTVINTTASGSTVQILGEGTVSVSTDANTITVSGAEASDVDSINSVTGAVTLTGSSNFPIRTEGQVITVSGADFIDNTTHAHDGGLIDNVENTIIVTSDGATITLTFDRPDEEPIEIVQISGSSISHPLPDSVTLTAAGTDTNPQENWVFLQESGGSLTLTSNTTGFPPAAHARVATAVVQTAQGVAASGVLKLHAFTDHVFESLERGSIGHTFAVSERIRAEHAQWSSGAALTTTVDTGPTPDNVTVQVATGVVLQLHTHTFPAFDTSASDLIFVFNDNTTPYKTVASLSEISEYNDGSSIGSTQRFNVVIWGAVSENQSDSKLFLNLPATGYNNDAKASDDTDNTAVFTIPSLFTGTGFLLARLTLKKASGGNTWTVINNLDLRGATASTFPGGVAVGGGGVTDHGLLTGILDDDHTQYSLVDGTRAFTGTVGGVTPAASSDLATKGYVDTVSGSLQTSIDAIDSSVTLQDAYDNGDGTIASTGGKPVQTGDLTATGTLDLRGDSTLTDLALSFSDDSNTGIFSSTDGRLSFVINGSETLRVDNVGGQRNLIILSAGNATSPALQFNDADTGFFRAATDTLSLAVGGEEIVRWIQQDAASNFMNVKDKVGINFSDITVEPDESLHVVGSGILTGDIIATSGTFTTGLTSPEINGDTEFTGNIISKGISWTSRTSAADNNWRGVIYGNGIFVAVSNNGGGNNVMTSPDGVTWTSRTSAADNNWNPVTYGNGIFVAVAYSGDGNRVMTSPDGINWTIRASAADNIWRGIIYANGLFVAVSSSGSGDLVMTSPDGITWTSRTAASGNEWYDVTYGNGLFVAVAQSGLGNRVMTSPDGINWTSRSSAADNTWVGVTYGNGLFVAVSDSGASDRVMTSPDGITWTGRTAASGDLWNNVTYGNGLFVAVSSDGTVMTSPDGMNWTSRTSAADNSWHDVTYGNGIFVAVAQSGLGNRVMTSGKSESNVIPHNNILQGGREIRGDLDVTGSVTASGSIGIGTDIPSEALDVVGSGIFTGDLDVQGELTSPTGTFSTSLTVSGIPVSTGASLPIETTAVSLNFPGSGIDGAGDGSENVFWTVNYDFDATSVRAKTVLGSLTYSVLFNDVIVEGLDNQTVNTSESVDVATSALAYTANDEITVAISGAASAKDLRLSLNTVRT